MYKKYAKLRDAKGMNDHQVSKETGIPVTTLYDFRNRHNGALSVGNLAKLAKYFNVPIEYFLKEE